MQPVFLDTNVVIDLLARREPFYKEAQLLFTMADRGQLQLQISALTFANASYALAKHYPVADAKKYLQQFKVLVSILPLDDKAIELALASEFLDIEDGFQYFAALAGGAGVIVTRNKKDFKKSALPVLTPTEFLKRWSNSTINIFTPTKKAARLPALLLFYSMIFLHFHLDIVIIDHPATGKGLFDRFLLH